MDVALFKKRALPYRRVLTRTTRYAVWWPSVTTRSTKDCTGLSSFASPSWSRRGRGWAGLYLTLYVNGLEVDIISSIVSS